MAAALPFIMYATAAVGAVAAIQQGQAAKAASEYNAELSAQNAALSREEAAQLARQHDRETFLRLGAIRAAQGGSGGEMSGSALDVLGDVAAESERERQYIIYSGEMKARGHQNTASLDRMRGDAAQTGSYYKAGSELLTGASAGYGASQRLKRG